MEGFLVDRFEKRCVGFRNVFHRMDYGIGGLFFTETIILGSEYSAGNQSLLQSLLEKIDYVPAKI